MTPQVGIETAAGFAQAACVGGDGVHQGADRVGGGGARFTPSIRLEPDGDRWRVRIGRFVTVNGDVPIEVMRLAAVLLGHDERVSRTVEVGR
jgi:hypothetical protein